MVSKSLPTVSTVSVPLKGAVQRYQTDARGVLTPAWSGSPVSLVARMLLPLTVPLLPPSTVALAKASFSGIKPTGSTATNALLLVTLPKPLEIVTV